LVATPGGSQRAHHEVAGYDVKRPPATDGAMVSSACDAVLTAPEAAAASRVARFEPIRFVSSSLAARHARSYRPFSPILRQHSIRRPIRQCNVDSMDGRMFRKLGRRRGGEDQRTSSSDFAQALRRTAVDPLGRLESLSWTCPVLGMSTLFSGDGGTTTGQVVPGSRAWLG